MSTAIRWREPRARPALAALLAATVAASPTGAAADSGAAGPASLRMRPPPRVAQAPALSDEELAKLAAQEADTEIMTDEPALVLGESQASSLRSYAVGPAAGAMTVGEYLQRSPWQGSGLDTRNELLGDGASRIALRGIGARRTRVLLDGRPVAPSGSGADDSVDLGAIPLALVSGVKLEKDGPQPAYAPDAAAGVVDITTAWFDGLSADAQIGTSGKRGGSGYELLLGSGHGQGVDSILFAMDYQDQRAVMAGALASSNATAPRTSLAPQGPAEPVAPARRFSMFSRGQHVITPRTTVFFEASFARRDSTEQGTEPPFALSQIGPHGVVVSRDSLYNPTGADIADLSGELAALGPRTTEREIDTSRLLVGVDGRAGEGQSGSWWHASYTYGRSTSITTRRGEAIASHLARALGPSFDDPARGPTCGAPSAPVLDGCVPLDVLTPGPGSPAAVRYAAFTGTESGLDEQHVASASALHQFERRPLLGEFGLELSGDYRFDRGARTPDPLTAIGDTTAGASAPTAGSYHSFDGTAGLWLHPALHTHYLRASELLASVSAHDHSRSGSGVTEAVSGSIYLRGHLRLRGSYGTAIRAPSIGELFAGRSDRALPLRDPCDATAGAPPTTARIAAQCAVQGVPDRFAASAPGLRTTLVGNRALRPETSTTATAGVVYEPVSALGIMLDYWHIAIDRAIETLPPAIVLAQCYQGGVASFCDQIQRDPATHQITRVLDAAQNTGRLTTSGIDLTAAVRHRSPLGRLEQRLEATWLFRYDLDTGAIDPVTGARRVVHGRDVADLGVHPDLRLGSVTTLSRDGWWSVGLQLRYAGSFEDCERGSCSDPANLRRTVPRYVDADLFATYDLSTCIGRTTFSVGVNNVASVQPPAIDSALGIRTDASAYDLVGRWFYLRISHRM